MKHLPAILLYTLGAGILALAVLAGYEEGLRLAAKRPAERDQTQSHLDHERTMNWLLARRVGEQEKGK